MRSGWAHVVCQHVGVNNLLLEFPPPAQGSNWDAHRTEVDEGTTSTRVGNLSWKCVYHIPPQWYLATEKVQAITLPSIYRPRIMQKICLWIDFGRAPSWCDTWLSAPCVLHHNTENLTSGTKSQHLFLVIPDTSSWFPVGSYCTTFAFKLLSMVRGSREDVTATIEMAEDCQLLWLNNRGDPCEPCFINICFVSSFFLVGSNFYQVCVMFNISYKAEDDKAVKVTVWGTAWSSECNEASDFVSTTHAFIFFRELEWCFLQSVEF